MSGLHVIVHVDVCGVCIIITIYPFRLARGDTCKRGKKQKSKSKTKSAYHSYGLFNVRYNYTHVYCMRPSRMFYAMTGRLLLSDTCHYFSSGCFFIIIIFFFIHSISKAINYYDCSLAGNYYKEHSTSLLKSSKRVIYKNDFKYKSLLYKYLVNIGHSCRR